MTLLAFQPVVDLVSALGDEEESAEDEHEIAPRDLLAKDGEERRRELHDPAEREQQQDPHQHRQHQTDLAGPLLLGLGELSRQDGEEDDVVDAQDDLEDRERGEANPGLRVGYPVHEVEGLGGGQGCVVEL